jgi:hypothetical protein
MANVESTVCEGVLEVPLHEETIVRMRIGTIVYDTRIVDLCNRA